MVKFFQVTFQLDNGQKLKPHIFNMQKILQMENKSIFILIELIEFAL